MSFNRDQDKIRKEIEKHKWIKSEDAGKDIGWYRAKVDWLVNHFSEYIKHNPLKKDDETPISKPRTKICPACKGIGIEWNRMTKKTRICPICKGKRRISDIKKDDE